MKKNLFILSAVAIALTSCSDEEVMKVNNSDAINFRAAVGSRATETTINNLNSFSVSAFVPGGTYFENVIYSKPVEDECVFSTVGDQYYWPGNEEVTFWMHAPYGEALPASATSTANGITFNNFTTPGKISEQVDLIAARATGSKTECPMGPVVDFDHRLSQIEIKAKNTNESYSYKVKGVRIANVKSKANISTATDNFKNWNYNNLSDNAIYGVTYNNEIDLTSEAQSLMGTSGNAMLIPQTLEKWSSRSGKSADEQGSYISVLVQITSAYGTQIFPETDGKYGWVAVPIDGTWEAGNRYIYTLDFSKGAGFPAPDQGSETGGNGGQNTNIQDDGDDVGSDIDSENLPDGPSSVEEGVEDDDPSSGSIFGLPINFSVGVATWTTKSNPTNM